MPWVYVCEFTGKGACFFVFFCAGFTCLGVGFVGVIMNVGVQGAHVHAQTLSCVSLCASASLVQELVCVFLLSAYTSLASHYLLVNICMPSVP